MTKLKAKSGPQTPETPKSRRLDLAVAEGVTLDKAVTDMAAAGLAVNAGLVVKFSQAEHGELSLSDMVKSLREAGDSVNRNDFSGAERMLNAQAVALNSIFAELARRAACNMGEYLDATDRYMRLALKAQSQCRTTLETLAVLKNPPVVYAKQANIAHGPQQVNNGPPSFGSSTHRHAHASEQSQSTQSKLLEGEQHGGTLLDTGATGTAAAGNPALEAVGAVNRPAQRGRKGDREP